jgi:peroxiredoxin
MKKYIYFAFAAIVLYACNSTDSFKTEGTVANADNKTLYLEHIGLMKTTVIDSVKLNSDGEFSFKGKRPEYPDFYRLRLDNRTIDFAVDSCEKISFKADAKNFSSGYSVEGSTTSASIQKLRKSLNDIQAKVNLIKPELTTAERSAILSEIEADIAAHKKMAGALVLQNPRSAAAYYAIYQQLNNAYLFSPYSDEDRPYCAAVATAYNAFMPEYDRTKNLYSLVMDAIRTNRRERSNQEWKKIIEQSGVGYIDIALNDKSGKTRKLSELEGKLILIDFSAYEMENSVQYTFALRELYNKYHSRGLEIYQISLDRSKLMWEEATASIPWICVRDENGTYASSYNVQQVPTIFLMNRKGEIISRSPDHKELERLISQNL